MAENALQAETESANPHKEIYELATNVQIRCSYARSLSDAVAEAGDNAHGESHKEYRLRQINNLVHFASLIESEVEAITKMSEDIERIARRMERSELQVAQ